MPKTSTTARPKTAAKAGVKAKPAAKRPPAGFVTKGAKAVSTPVAKVTPVKPAGPRRLSLPKRVWYSPLTWRHKQSQPDYKPLPKARVLLRRTFQQLWANKKLFGGILGIYALLNIVLVRGLASTTSANLTSLKSTLDLALHGFSGKLVTSLAGFATLVGDSGASATATSGVYQYILLTVCGLAAIWAFRHISAKGLVRVRDGFYQGTRPLIPFVLVQLAIGLQLVPIAVGSGIYNILIADVCVDCGAALVVATHD
jgi:hypothetical protein